MSPALTLVVRDFRTAGAGVGAVADGHRGGAAGGAEPTAHHAADSAAHQGGCQGDGYHGACAEAAGGGFFLLGRLAVSLPPLEEAWFWLSAAFPPVQFRAGVVIGTMIQVGLGIAIVIGILVKVHQSSLLCC